MVVEDVMPEGLLIEAIEVYRPLINHDGEVISIGDLVDASEYTINNTSVNFVNEVSTPYLVRYITKISDDFKPNDGGNLEFYNKAIMRANNVDEIEAGATLVASYGKLLHKSSPSYDSNTQTFTWNIQYNYGEKTIENGVLIDTFDPNLEYVSDSLVVMSMDNQEVDVKYSVVENNNQIKIIFEETISDGYNISYQTKVKEGVLITEDLSLENKVETEDKTSTSTGKAVPRLINKFAGHVNYTDKTIPWTIYVNNNNYEMSNYSLSDKYISGGLTMKQDSFRIKNVTKNIYLDEEDYVLTITYNNQKETGFYLELVNGYETTSDQFEIVFDTYYDINELKPEDNNTFRNHVRLNWIDEYGNPHRHDDNAISDVNSFTIHNGRKIGSYNAVTKEIKWQVDVNYNSEKISGGRVVDKIEEGQKFLDESLEIYTYSVLKDGQIKLQDKMNLSDFDIDYPNDANENTLTVHLPKDNDIKYSIHFRTSVESEAIRKNYKNEAIFSNGEFERHLSALVTVTNGDKFISKGGVQVNDVIDWKININESQSLIRDAEIHDFPCVGQILLEDTFYLYPVIIKENEAYEIDYDNPLQRDVDYDLVFNVDENGRESFVLSFKNDIDRTYILKYSSQINLSVDHTEISNLVKFKGNEITYETEDGPTRIIVDLDSAGGDAFGQKGSFKLRKVDVNGRPLEGVHFDLYNRLERKVASRVTDENGEIEFSNLIYSDYKLYETKALKGYVISDELYKGIEVLVNDETSGSEYVLVLENRMSELLLRKTNAAGDTLSNARFELVKVEADDTRTIVESDFTVDSAGKIFYGLETGNYELKERFAPEGYIINDEVISFVIDEDQNNQAINLALDIVNYQGSVSLSKVDADNNALAGVVFNLYDQNDQLVKEALVTDDQGMIHINNELAPGNYYFKELSSVHGNLVNETPLHFTIVSRATGEPERVEVKATNFKGSVQFRKVSESKNPLANVEFELYTKEDVKIATVYSDVDGYVRVDQLEPGAYYFKESNALKSYIKNTAILSFEIAEKVTADHLLVDLGDFVNYRGKINVLKVDENGKLLSEAQFKLFDDSQKLVKKFTTQDGEFTVQNLSPGTYTLEEVLAPEGYLIKDEKMEIVIPTEFEGDYTAETIHVVNVKEEPKVTNPKKDTPKTGLQDYSGLFTIILVIGFVGIMTLKRMKKKNI